VTQPWHTGSGERLHEPWRLAVAAVELLLAAGAMWTAFACWGSALGTVTVHLPDGTDLVSRTYAGNWVAGAVGLATLAGLLVVDAVREFSLGIRARGRTARGSGRAHAR
jgi:hypothetical protein